jgi:dsRNA-specific ribonuclease
MMDADRVREGEPREIAMPRLRSELYQRRQAELAGWEVGIASYKIGDRFICEVDNVSPGARLARGEGATREDAEQQALASAQRRLERTRVHAPE